MKQTAAQKQQPVLIQSSFDIPLATKIDFARDLAKLREQAERDMSLADLRHLKKFEWWGRLCTLAGLATAWLFFNPFSALLIAIGNVNRWANINHPIAHGGFDKISGVPDRYTTRAFAKGWRRIVDWYDWILPQGWHIEHNQLHHYRLGEVSDPDQIELNLYWLRESGWPMVVRYVVVALFACVWKPAYYTQSTLKELRRHEAKKTLRTVPASMSRQAWSIFYPEGREYWFRCIMPYVLLRFVLIPVLFLPLGTHAVINVALTMLLAEALANLHSFLVIAPNHTGDDIARFTHPIKNKEEFYYRQVAGSVNYRTGSDLNDFLHGGLNYQIEHHLWPAMPLRQYQKLQPEVKALCAKYGIVYRQESVFRRLKKTVDVMVGKTSQPISD